MVDYLTGSPFGQAAGSLLKRRDRDWKKALGISLLDSFVQNLNLQKQSQNQKNIERTQEEYNQIFSNNEEIWAAKANERALWAEWNAAKRRGAEAEKDWIDNQAIQKFNQDAVVRDQMGENAYHNLRGLTQESRDKALAHWRGIREQFVSELQTFKNDRTITTPTQTKFNEPAYRELQAQLDIYTDDPARQNVILDTFGNIFGIHDRKRAELALALENAQRVRREQEATFEMGTYEGNNRIRNLEIAEVMRNEVGVLPDGTSVASEEPPPFPGDDWTTTAEVIEEEERRRTKEWREGQEGRAERSLTLQEQAAARAAESAEWQERLQARQVEEDIRADEIARRQRELEEIMQAKNYGTLENPILEEHFVEALYLNINPLNLPNMDAILKHNAAQVTRIFGIAHEVNTYRSGDDVADYLPPHDLYLYDTIMGTRKTGEDLDPNARVQDEAARYMAAEFVIRQMGDPEKIPTAPIYLSGTETTDVLKEDPSRLLSFLEGDFLITGQKEASTEQSQLFINHMLMAAEKLEKKYDMPQQEAMREAFALQLRGIDPEASVKGVEEHLGQSWLGSWWPGGKTPGEGHTWYVADPNYLTHTSDYVDPDTMTIIENIIPSTAHRAAREMTSQTWIHRTMTYYDEDSETSRTFKPAKGKSFTMPRDEGEDFEITFTSVPNIHIGQTAEGWKALPDGHTYKTYKWNAEVSYIDE